MPWSIACSCISISCAPVSDISNSMGSALFRALLGLRSQILAFSKEPKTLVACSITRSSLCTRSDSSRLNSVLRLASVRGGATSWCSSLFEKPLLPSFEIRSLRIVNAPFRASLDRLDRADPATRFNPLAERRFSLFGDVCFACFAICRKFSGIWHEMQEISTLLMRAILLWRLNVPKMFDKNLHTNYWPGRCLIAEFRERLILAKRHMKSGNDKQARTRYIQHRIRNFSSVSRTNLHVIS